MPTMLYIICLFATGLAIEVLQYEYNTDDARFIEPLKRSKREEELPKLASPLDDEKIPDDVEVEEETSEHIYYNMTIYSDNPEMLKKHYVDVHALLNAPDVEGHKNHPSLVQSYRKAAGAPIGFAFPFYGHNISNLTIATGGFCYVGDQTHSWLAATQYIAPLMANFDTLDESASIAYVTDKSTRMVIAWNNVSLRDNRDAGLFNFETILYSNGDIIFVYKDVPTSIRKISDLNHPSKIGVSDAYLFNHRLNDKLPQSMQMKRVIHEYHRISVIPDKITSNTVVILKALPTCLQFQDCNSCINSTLKTFNCSWCNPKDTNVTAFCSDQAGLHRRRQDWIENDCSAEMSTNSYCPAADVKSTTRVASTTTEEPVTAPEVDLQNKFEQDKIATAAKASGGSGMATLTVIILLFVAAGCWLLYAYNNPHSTSGQLLIKYRPSKWAMPTHVRYSRASNVHM